MFPKELMNLCDFDNVLRHELRQPLEGFPQATLEHALRWDPDGAAPHLRKHLIKGLGGRGREGEFQGSTHASGQNGRVTRARRPLEPTACHAIRSQRMNATSSMNACQ